MTEYSFLCGRRLVSEAVFQAVDKPVVQPVTQGRRISQLACSGDSGPSHLGIYLSSISLCK